MSCPAGKFSISALAVKSVSGSASTKVAARTVLKLSVLEVSTSMRAGRSARAQTMDKLQYLQNLKSIRDSVPPDRRDNFDLQFAARAKEPAIALILSLVFGSFGIDRFYLGHIVLGILKLITFGAFFVWTIIDWF